MTILAAFAAPADAQLRDDDGPVSLLDRKPVNRQRRLRPLLQLFDDDDGPFGFFLPMWYNSPYTPVYGEVSRPK